MYSYLVAVIAPSTSSPVAADVWEVKKERFRAKF